MVISLNQVCLYNYPSCLLYIQDNPHRYSQVANTTLRLHPQGTHFLPSTHMLLLLGSHSWHLPLHLNNPFSHRIRVFMCPDQFWINRTNFAIIFGPAGPLLVAKIGPAGPIFPPDQIFPDRPPMLPTIR